MNGHGRLYAKPGGPAREVAEALAWLWRLGPLLDGPSDDAVGLGSLAELKPLIGDGRLAGAIVFCDGDGSEGVPPTQVVKGRARFPGGERNRGAFTIFDDGQAVVHSSLGRHAVREGSTLFVGATPAGWWGRIEAHWILDALARFLPEVLERPLVMLPPVGVVRLDDAPGTAQHQMQGRSKSDAAGRRLAHRLRRAYRRNGATLNIAVAAEALEDGRRVPLDRVWPGAVEAFAGGVAESSLEPVCHGLLHLVPEELERGEVDWLEFLNLDEQEAGRRIDTALDWHERCLGRRPTTFCAPAWGYSAGTRAAAATRDLPVWLPPSPAPLLDEGGLHETIDPALHGLQKFDFRPFRRFADAGLPPTLVFHGRTFDLRMESLRKARDVVGVVRTLLKRDIYRVPDVEGVTWIRAGDYAGLLRAHDSIEVRGASVDLAGTTHALVRDGRGTRSAIAF